MKVIKNGRNFVKNAPVAYINEEFELRPDLRGKVGKHICWDCGCEYEFTPKDVLSQVYVDRIPDAKEQGNYGYMHYVICPECGKRHQVTSTLEVYSPGRFGEQWYEGHKDANVRVWDGYTFGSIDWWGEFERDWEELNRD